MVARNHVERHRLPAALREFRGEISQDAIASELEITRNHYSEVERGTRSTTEENLLRIGKFLEKDPLPLLVAKAADQGRVCLPTRLGDRDSIAALLAVLWGSLTDDQVAAVAAVIRGSSWTH